MTHPRHPLLDASPLWNKQRRELARWLDDNAPSFTPGYVAAVRLLHETDFPARVHIVCHLVRDVYRFLPAALGSKVTPHFGHVFPQMIQDLVSAWDATPETESVTSDNTPSESSVDPRVYREVKRIVDKSKELRKTRRVVGAQLATALFRSIERREDEFIPPRIIESFDLEYDFFVARAHLRADGTPTTDGLVEHFESFERSFHSLIGGYFTGKEELDAILRDANAPAD